MRSAHRKTRSRSRAPVLESDLDSADDRVVPTWTESQARQMSKVLGGPLGRHACLGRHWFFTPLRAVLLAAVATLVIGWFTKAPCIQQTSDGHGGVVLDWSGHRQYTAMCYSDVIPLYSGEDLDSGAFPYAHAITDYTTNSAGQRIAHTRYMEYPVLTGLFQWGNAKITTAWEHYARAGLLPTGLPVAVYFDVTAFFLSLAWIVTVWAVTRTARRRPWDAMLVAFSPLVVFQAFTNFDAIATAFAATAILAWSRRRPVLAGLLLGLGGAAKLYPLFLLFPLLLLCLRSGKLRQWAAATGAAAGAWLVADLPILLLYPRGWSEFFRLNTTRGAGVDSLYRVISDFTVWNGFSSVETLNTVSAALFAAACVAIAWVVLAAPRRPRLAQVCFLVVAVFLLTNKVWSPQYSLWLVPLAALAIPRWKVVATWMVIDALVWVPRMMMYLQRANLAAGEPDRGLPPEWFHGAVILRDLAVLGLCALIVRAIYRPRADLVRESDGDDPAGGVLEGAADARKGPGIGGLAHRRRRGVPVG